MKPKLRKVLLWVSFPVFYLFCFVLSAYLTFPFDMLRDQVIVRFAESQRKSGENRRLEIDSLSSYRFSGIQAKGVRIITAPHTTLMGKQKPGNTIEIKEVTARVSLLPLLIGRVSVGFSAEAFGGTIDGSTWTKGGTREIELALDNVAVGQIEPMVNMVGLPLGGRLGGQVHVVLNEGKASKADGTVKLATRALPRVEVGTMELACEIEQGKVTISKFEASGQDLDFAAEGKITLRDRLAESTGDVFFRFRFSDRYRGKDDKTKALFGAPGSTAPALFELASRKIRTAKRSDGFYSFRALGILKNLSFSAAPAGASSSRAGGSKDAPR